jgi:hypothetical protein
MKFIKIFIFCVIIGATFLPAALTIRAQQPCPRVGPCDNPLPMPTVANPTGNVPVVPAPTPHSLSFSDYMQEITLYSIALRKSFIRTVEATLGGYFLTLAYWLTFIVFLAYFVKAAYAGAWNAGEIGRQTLTLAFCLLALIYCGDVDGDGVHGDLVNQFASAGNSAAYGTASSDSYIGSLVEYERQTFDLNYKNFVENKFMVRVNNADMPVKYPGEETVTILGAIYTGKTVDNPELKTKSESREWKMGALFQFLNVGRGFMEFIDFFLLWLQGFLIITARLVCPFMVAAAVNPDLRKKMSVNFFWSLLVVTVIFPIVTQIFRYIGFVAGNLGLGVNPTEQYFYYDPTTTQFVANGNPEYIIFIAGILMFFAGFLLLFSLGIAYKLMQGSVLEGVSSAVSAAFTTLSSIGFGAVVSGYSTRLSTQAERTQIEGSYSGATTGADYNKQASMISANAAKDVATISAGSTYDAKMAEAMSKNLSSKQGAFGSMQSGLMNVQAEQYQSVNSAMANSKHNLESMNLDEKKAYADNFVDLLSKNDDATSKRIAQVIEQEPEKLDLIAEQYDNVLKGIPIGGSVASALGVNKDALNSWMRTDGFKATGQLLFGNPETGQGGIFNNGKVTSKMFEQNKELSGQLFNGNAGNGLVYERPDGTKINALTGQRMSTNVEDQTNPNNPVDYSNQPTVGKVFSGAGTGNSVAGMTKTQKQNFAKMNQLFARDPNFLPALQKMSQKNGWNTNEMLNLFALETAGTWNPAVVGGAGGNYVGLIQFGKDARKDVGLPSNVNEASRFLGSISPSQQLPYVEKYLRGVEKATGQKLNNFGSLYAAVGGGSGNYQNAMKNGGIVFSQTSNNAKNRAGYNANAKSWDYNRDGNITVQEFGKASFSKLGGGAYFDANNMIGQIRKVDPPTAKVLAKKFSSDYQLESSMRNNQSQFEGKNQSNSMYYQGKREAETNYTNEQIGITNAVAGMKTQGVQTQYNWSVTSADTALAGEKQAAGITRAGSLETRDVQFKGSTDVANVNYDREMKVAEITKSAAIQSSYERALSNAVQSVGSNVVHHFSESVEKFNRF